MIFRDNAHKYAALGWAVFPQAVGEKVPAIKGGGGFKGATTDRATIARWAVDYAACNIGIATGKVSGIIAIDFDPRAGCMETIARLRQEGKVFPETVTSVTPNAGRHQFYAYDPRVTVSGSNKLGPGIDVKTDGGCITVAPSVWSGNGNAYQWKFAPKGPNLPAMPIWVVQALTPRPEPKRPPAAKFDPGNAEGYRRQALQDLHDVAVKVAALTDGRHLAPFNAACQIGKYHAHGLLSEEEIERVLLDASDANGALRKYCPRDLAVQIRNGLARARSDVLPPLARIHRVA